MPVNIAVSVGELWDKYTILKIKELKISDDTKLQHVKKEIRYLDTMMEHYILDNNYFSLEKVNNKLWEIEDNIREKERLKEFDSEFIELARSVYIINDERASIKHKINEKYKSEIHEVKSYKKYV
tara:strand:- start:426 stop:800 length:375 start_codon:yes stop_codon:yes gene_type:complete